MTGQRPEELLDALASLPAWRRERQVCTEPAADIEALGEPWTRAILAQTQHRGPPDVAERLVRHGYGRLEVEEAAADLSLLAVSRGRLHEAHAGRGLRTEASAYLQALSAVEFRSPDLEGVYADLDVKTRSEAEMLLLSARASLQRNDRDGAEHLVGAAIGRLFSDDRWLSTVFWAVFETLADGSLLLEGLVLREAALVALQVGDAPLAFLLSRRLLLRVVSDADSRSVLSDLVAPLGRRLLSHVGRLDPTAVDEVASALHVCAIFSGDFLMAAEALQIGAQMAFVTGCVAAGVERQRGFAHLSGRGHRTDRILAVPALWTDEIAVLPSTKSFRFVGDAFTPLDPMARVDGLPLTNYPGLARSWVAEISNAEVIGGDTLGSVFHYVLTEEKSLILDGLNIHPSYHMGRTVEAFRAYSPTGDVLLDLSYRRDSEVIRGRACLIGGVANYYHWLFEYLPRLGLVQDAGFDVSELKLLINARPSDWQMESLELAGVLPGGVAMLKGDPGVVIDELVVPSLPSTAYAVSYLRRAFGVEPPSLADKIVYVSRVDVAASRSRIANEMELIDQLLARDATILVAGEETFRSQIELFASAKLVIAPHGAGLANIAFCPEGATVIEINNRTNASYTFFEEIARAARLNFSRYVAAEEVAHGPPEDAASVIDIAAISQLIDAALVPQEG